MPKLLWPLSSVAVLFACGELPTRVPGILAEPTLAIAPANPAFIAPFVDSLPLANFFDHTSPTQGNDGNPKRRHFWGETVFSGVNGHAGYDWLMPVGTPIRAVAAGRVTAVLNPEPPFYCPSVDSVVSGQKRVVLTHRVGGENIETHYIHLNTIGVTAGQGVPQGMTIGTSGNTGCSTQPHLHFETRRLKVNQIVPIDPFGWTVTTTDPWITGGGVASINLWSSAPRLFREVRLAPNPAGGARVTITAVRWMGVDDAVNRNNEFVELALNTNVSQSESLVGFQIRGDRSGFTFTITDPVTLTTANPRVQIFSGTGTPGNGRLFMGRNTPMWSNNFDDCARRISPTGLEFNVDLGGGCP